MYTYASNYIIIIGFGKTSYSISKVISMKEIRAMK